MPTITSVNNQADDSQEIFDLRCRVHCLQPQMSAIKMNKYYCWLIQVMQMVNPSMLGAKQEEDLCLQKRTCTLVNNDEYILALTSAVCRPVNNTVSIFNNFSISRAFGLNFFKINVALQINANINRSSNCSCIIVPQKYELQGLGQRTPFIIFPEIWLVATDWEMRIVITLFERIFSKV